MIRVFINSPGDRGSIPDRIIPKTQKWYLIFLFLRLSIIRYISRVKWVKWSNPGRGVVPSPASRCSSYWKGSLWVTVEYGRPTYNLLFTCSKWLNSSIWPKDGTLTGTTILGQSGLGVMAVKRYSWFPKLQDWNLTIRWFSIIPRTLVNGGRSQPTAEVQLRPTWSDELKWIHYLAFNYDVSLD